MKTIREHGIKEISIEQYKTDLKKIVCFADEHGFSSYYPELKDDFDAFINSFKCREKQSVLNMRDFSSLSANLPTGRYINKIRHNWSS